MKSRLHLLFFPFAICLTMCPPHLVAQSGTELFGPINIRVSNDGASFANPDTFNSNTLNLSCPAVPTAVLSSSSDGSGNVLVDNNIFITNLTANGNPVNVCTTGVDPGLPSASCFTKNYENTAAADAGQSPDHFVATGGVAPIDISSYLSANTQQKLKIDLVDEGGYVTNSTLYLVTNCTSGGVSGPALISGNTIPPTGPSPQQLKQDFIFNPSSSNMVDFQFDLTGAQNAGTLNIDPSGVNPRVGDSFIDPTNFGTLWGTGTPFATSICLIHSGESLPNGGSACKLYTLECTTGTGSNASGAQCPVSTQANEVFKDTFDGPPFTLPDIHTPGGTTYHEGIGFLMATEGWIGGTCVFDPAAGLQQTDCPQNLLTSFTGPGLYIGGGLTTHPNSSFIMVAQVPEALTTVSVDGMQPGNWINSSTAKVTLSTQPPYLVGSPVPNAVGFTPSPISTLTYGISPANSVPAPGDPIATDKTLTNSQACPVPGVPSGPLAPTFTPDVQTLSGLSDGNYLLHYYSQDCAGTNEFLFTQDNSGSWSTHFYTFAINVDTTMPTVSNPTLTANGPYYQGQPVQVSFSCSDTGSGIVSCGNHAYPAGTANTGTVTATLDTSSSGAKTFTIVAIDAAGNQSSQVVNYQVQIDGNIALSLSSGTVTYPLGTNLTVKVTGVKGHVPTGTVQITERGSTLITLNLNSGAAFYYLKGLPAGLHSLSAVYSGDPFNAGGVSAAVSLNVLPVPVTLSLSCWNTPYPYGADFHCGVYASSNAGAPLGSITYTYDGQAPVTLALSSGTVNLIIPKPPVGNHTIVVNYAAQTNYAAAGPKTQQFSVTPAPVIVQFNPSSWYLTGGTLTLTASIQSWSAGPPNATGQVTFTDGTNTLATVTVNAAGVATTTVAASSLTNGNHTLKAAYSGGTNYGTGSTSISVQVAH